MTGKSQTPGSSSDPLLDYAGTNRAAFNSGSTTTIEFGGWSIYNGQKVENTIVCGNCGEPNDVLAGGIGINALHPEALIVGPEDLAIGVTAKLAAPMLKAAVPLFRAATTETKGLTYLYQKLGRNGEHLKYGITKNPATRYTAEQLDGGRLKILSSGSRQDMLKLERDLHETLPIGPEEGQSFYIQKQIEKGLTPPPYE